MSRTARMTAPSPGPVRADQIRHKDPYEVSGGYAYRTQSTGNRGAQIQGHVFAAIANDPAVERAGVDAGFSPRPDMLRAPDIAVIPGPAAPGWVKGVPPFAIEYADVGQDEVQLQAKIQEFMSLGTQQIWVVRLTGLPRVEVYTPGGMRLHARGDVLEVPGVLARPVPVDALFDPEEARKLELDNLLARLGYRSVDDIAGKAHEEGRQEGRVEGQEEGRKGALRVLLAARGLTLSPEQEVTLRQCSDLPTLDRWLAEAAVAVRGEGLFGRA